MIFYVEINYMDSSTNKAVSLNLSDSFKIEYSKCIKEYTKEMLKNDSNKRHKPS